jgi:2'-5' RNA ligase
MAGNKESSASAIFATNSYDTALCIIPPTHECHDIDQLRSLYDKAYGSWPPHINLIYPFVAPEHLPQATDQIKKRFAKLDSTSPFNVCLNRAGYFAHRLNNTVFLAENKPLNESSLDLLRKIALEAVGQDTTPCNFHLTIGQSEDQTESSRDFLLSKTNLVPQVNVPITQLAILVREKIQGSEKSANRMRLWGVIALQNAGRHEESTLSEFWIPSTEQQQLDEDYEDDDEDDEKSDYKEPMTASPFNRKVQPGTTYQYSDITSTWVACMEDSITENAPTTFTVSSYNVLIDSVYPPARDRDPLLLATILSRSALADVLVMQEVSDDFLSYLLADARVRKCYPFTTHGPPSQPDISPLPSLRNVVILSKWYLSWEMVPFHRRHKGAVVAKLKSISKNGSSESLPLVIAGVHLTCGLTDGSVAAKRVQLQNLKNHLTRHYPSNPWVIAGDFNITTSSYTIRLAVKNKNISPQTVKTLASMENMLTDVGLVDAWSTARVEGVDQSSIVSDDLFDGEDGATFNPRENELAAATSGTSHNRPQRYDRILIRPQGMLRVGRFDHFGIPETHEGVQVVPSDHSGIRAAMKIVTEVSGKQLSDEDMLTQHHVQARCASESLVEVVSLTSALDARHMFPTEEEAQCRKEAFSIIKEVILGSSNDEDTKASEIPMVMVPVGSYALGVWTTASDIDCLCIGSISSKTFFKLARQRIHRAEAHSVRLLRRVEASTGTMFELSVNGISMDLQYCPAAQVVER